MIFLSTLITGTILSAVTLTYCTQPVRNTASAMCKLSLTTFRLPGNTDKLEKLLLKDVRVFTLHTLICN